MRLLLVSSGLVLGIGCGGDGGPDPGGPDAPEGEADAANDAAMTADAGACSKPPVFVNTLAAGTETYTEGPDDSSANRSSIIDGTAMLGPTAGDLAAIVAASRAVLEPLGIAVTDVDPGSALHLEVVIAGTGWPFPAGYAAVAPGYCSFRANGVAMVNAFPGRTPEDLAVSVAYTVGLLDGLELSTTTGNCMEQSLGGACTFSATAATIQPPRCAGVGATQDQLAILGANLACE
jgi:hypothetical protein